MSSSSRPSSQAGHGRAASSRRVIVSLEFLPTSTPVQTPITNEFSSHLPLTDLQWKSSSRSTTRTIETLSLDFRSFRETARDAPQQQIPTNLLERPYLHLLFIASDDNEAYRITLRPQIREWLNTVQAKKLQEWLIVHVTTQKTGPAKFYQRKGSVFDKIRADFNVSKRDRVLQLPVPGSQADEGATDYAAIWREFLSKTKESIVLSFDGNFASYEEDVRKIDAQRQMPGWNFCTFFILKEGLAHSFEAMNLLEDALLQYDELEASYSLGAKDQTFPWFSRIGGTMPGDDSLSILSSQTKQYRDLIMQNQISVFDFRIYLFSRQASLVIRLGRVVDLAKRAKNFIYSMAKLLRSHYGVLQKYFIESWIYTASLEVVNNCNDLLNSRKMNAAAIPDLLPIMAELSELATRQVEKLGMVFRYLPVAHPFLMSMQALPLDELEDTDAPNGSNPLPKFESSNTTLKSCFDNVEAFDVLYRSLLDRVHEAWTGSLRTRNANKIKGTLAALEQARKNTARALAIYASLATDFSQTRWRAIEAQVLRQTNALRTEATEPQERQERLLSVLALIRLGLEAGSLRWTLSTKNVDGAETAKKLLREAKELSAVLDKDCAVIDVPAFSVRLTASSVGFLSDEDGVKVNATIISYLPCNIDVDEVRFKLLSMTEEALWVRSLPTTLKPGPNSIELFALVTLVGTYALETSQIRFSKIVFQYSHRQHSSSRLQEAQRSAGSHIAYSKQPLLVFTQDPDAIDITADEPSDTSVDQPRQMILTIHPGRQSILKAILHISNPCIRVLYDTAKCIEGECSVMASAEERTIHLSSMASRGSVKLRIDYHATVQAQFVSIPVTMDYHTALRPEKRRLLKTCLRLRTGLPLDVTVHDYRRDTFLLSKFTVSTNERLPLRVKDAELIGTTRYRPISARPDRSRTVVVKQGQPGTFLFRLERQKPDSDIDGNDNEDTSRLKIIFTYRSVEADLLAVLRPHLQAMLEKHDAKPSRRLIEAVSSYLLFNRKLVNRFYSLHLLDSLGSSDLVIGEDDVQPAIKDSTRLKEYLRTYWTNDDEWDRIQNAVAEACQTPISTGLLINEPWNTVSIPFQVPSIAIFNRLSLSLPSRSEDSVILIGEEIPCTLHIHSSFDWANEADRRALQELCNNPSDLQNVYGTGQRMFYEFNLSSGDWVVAGKSRSDFYISTADGSHLEFKVWLVAMKAGKLFLPSVSIHPLPSIESSQRQNEQAQEEMYDNLPTCETYQEDAATYLEIVESVASSTEFYFDPGTGAVDYPHIEVQ